MAREDPVGQVVAANLRYLRQRRRWTLKKTAEELAGHLDGDPLSEAGLSRWENPQTPRRFAMTELYAICSVFGVPLARLFLPDLEGEIPTVYGQPYYAVWNACFDGTEKVSTDWQRVDFVQESQLSPSDRQLVALAGFSEDEVTEAVALLRRARKESGEAEEGDRE